MTTWLVEFEGQTKPLDSVTDPAFQVAVRDSRRYVEQALAAEPDAFAELKVIYSVDPQDRAGVPVCRPGLPGQSRSGSGRAARGSKSATPLTYWRAATSCTKSARVISQLR